MIMTIVVAYACFAIAEHMLHVSGVMAVVASAITMGILWVPRISQTAIHTVKETWEVIALISNSLLFLLVGLSVDVASLINRIDVIAIAILLVLLSRATTIYTLVPATIKWFSLPHVSLGERHIMWWGGLKGGLAIAIVLSVPEDLPGRDLLLDLTLGVVMFSLLVNAPTIKPLIQKLGIDKLTDDELAELKQGMMHAGKESSAFINRFYKAGIVSRSTVKVIQKNTDNVFSSDIPAIQKAQVNAAPLNANIRIILNTTIAVASFNNDSPSTRIVSLSGAPSSLNKEITATGSVAEISAPNNSAKTRSIFRKNHKPIAMKAVEMSSAGTASTKTGNKSLTNCLAFKLNADSNIKAGKNRNKTISGVS